MKLECLARPGGGRPGRRSRVFFRLALLSAAAGGWANADDTVINSKHDLSLWGPGPVRAINESQVCIFCHTPHNASPAAPLWNRHDPAVYYRIYRSRSLDANVDQPGPASKLCLSCHDGTLALGLTLDRPMTDPIPMTHTYLPTGESNLTTDLSDDHPIGFRYDRALANRDRNLRVPELVDHRIKLGERGELECIACHDPHNNELGDFLRLTDRNGALCRACHDFEHWPLSAHALSPRTVPFTVTRGERLPYRSLADNACRSCHLAHTAPWREKLLYDTPSQLCIECHNGVDATGVIDVIGQRSAHRVHPLLAQAGLPERFGVPRHVECTSCHNPHAAAEDALRGPLFVGAEAQIYVPLAMREVPGVTIGGAPVEEARWYYEVCFQCHSDIPAVVPGRILRQRDEGGNIRRQILPTAASAHPIAFPAAQRDEVPSLLPELSSRRVIGCQDCHNNPDARSVGGTGANGPHGSRFDHLAVRRYDTRDFTVESSQAYALCYGCHDRPSLLNDESFPLHRTHIVGGRSPCSACHAAHGVNGSPANHDHLINFDISIVGGRRFYLDTGRFQGTCTLECHGVNHVNFTYGP